MFYCKRTKMNEELDAIKYYTASEKVQNLIVTAEMTLEFMQEFKIEPDESVKQALQPVIDKLKDWIK